MNKKLIAFLSPFLMLAALSAYGALSELDKSTIGVTNKLVNPSAEGATAGYSKSGGTFTTGGTVGSKYFSWDSSAAGQTILSGYQTVSSGDNWSGSNGAISARFKCDSGTCTHKLQVYDGTNVLNEKTITSSTSTFTRTTVNFIYPSSGVIAWRLISVAADEPKVYWREGFQGLAEGFNLSQVSQAQIVGTGTWAGTASCSWSTSSSTFSNLGANASCPNPTVTDSATAPGTKIPALTFPSLAPGKYVVKLNGTMYNNSTSDRCLFRISDGSNTDGSSVTLGAGSTTSQVNSLEYVFNYTTPQTNVTFQPQAARYSGTTDVCLLQNNQSTANASTQVQMTVTYYPSQSQTGYKPDQTPASWSGTQVGAGGGWTTTATTYDDFSAATTSNTLTPNSNAYRNITCTADSSKKAAISCNLPKAGNYFVIASLSANNASTSAIHLRLVDGSGTVINGGVVQGSGTPIEPVTLPGGYYASSTTAVFKIQGYTSSSSNAAQITQSADTPITWTVIDLDAGTAAPYLMGSVTSNTSGQERVERARGILQSANTIGSQSGSWISSISHASTGLTTINIAAGIFSDTPTCIPTYASGASSGGAGGQIECVMTQENSATSVQVTCKQNGTLTDLSFNIHCMGPR